MDRPHSILFLCTGNSARSILAEAAVNALPSRRWRGYSAGSQPKGAVNPYAIELLARQGLPTAELHSKSWAVFAAADAPVLDVIVTVCDSAAGETCPYWPGQPVSAHWGMPDPAAVEGAPDQIRQAFVDTYAVLRRRIAQLDSLPLATLDRASLHRCLQDIAAS